MHEATQQQRPAQTAPHLGWPSLSTLIWLFVGFRLPILLLMRPGGYLRPYPSIGALGGVVEVSWQNWLFLGPAPLQPFLLDWLTRPLPTELSRQLVIGSLSLIFEIAALVLLYTLVRRHASEMRARRTTLFWGLLWFPVWSWLTGLEGTGVALALATLLLIDARRPLVAGVLGVVTVVWMPAAALVVVPVAVTEVLRIRYKRPLAHMVGLRAAGVLLVVLLLVRLRVTDPLVLLLPLVALLMPNVRGAVLAGTLSLLFVLHDPIAPLLVTVESSVIPLLAAGIWAVALGLALELIRPLIAMRGARLLRYGWQVGMAAGVLAFIVSVPIAIDEFYTIALEDSPFASLIPEFTQTPSQGYVLTGSHELYERIYALAWRRHTVRVVSERNSDELLGMITSDGGPVWIMAHPEEHDAASQLKQKLLDAGYPADGDWFGDIRLERVLIPPGPPLQPADLDATFADAVTLPRAGWQPSAEPGAWLPVDLTWVPPPDGAIPTAIFVHLRNAGGDTVAQHDTRPAVGWEQEQFTTRHALRLPPDLPAGTYQLVAGRYLPDSGERVLLVSGEDGIIIGDVTITNRQE